MSVPTQFTGYGAVNEAAGKAYNLTKFSYTPRTFTEHDVDIKITHTAICGSDCHVLSNGWPSPTNYGENGCIVGHEIVGEIVRAGSLSGRTIGQRVGVGAQGGSCLKCEYCLAKKEQFCDEGMKGTYQGMYNGELAQGGYADYTRQMGHFAIPIPDAISSADAAPLMCGGVTTYSPMKRFKVGPGKKVAIVGIGGLGHMGLMWSNALGAETYALSHSARKLADAEKLGLKPENFIITSDTKATIAKWSRTFDLIICTSFQTDLPVESLFFKLLRPEGTLVLCGLPEEQLPGMFGHALVGKSVSLAGSLIGGTVEIEEMLALAAAKNIRPVIQMRNLSDAAAAVQDMEAGKAHFRYVMDASK